MKTGRTGRRQREKPERPGAWPAGRPLCGLLVHGPDPAQLVAETELPEGYVGKILLVLLTGGGFDETVCLRSGDDWHREILHNTRAEIADLGFPDAQVHPLGGAHAGFESDGSIVIWGTSDESAAATRIWPPAIARAYPGERSGLRNKSSFVVRPTCFKPGFP